MTIEMDEPVELNFALRYLGFFTARCLPACGLHAPDVPIVVNVGGEKDTEGAGPHTSRRRSTQTRVASPSPSPACHLLSCVATVAATAWPGDYPPCRRDGASGTLPTATNAPGSRRHHGG